MSNDAVHHEFHLVKILGEWKAFPIRQGQLRIWTIYITMICQCYDLQKALMCPNNVKKKSDHNLSLFFELKSISSLAYIFFAILVAASLLGWAFETKTINHSRSSFWTINFSLGFRIVLNSSRSWSSRKGK